MNLEALEYIAEREYIVGVGGERQEEKEEKGEDGEGVRGTDGEGTAICEYVRRCGSHFRNCLRAHNCPF